MNRSTNRKGQNRVGHTRMGLNRMGAVKLTVSAVLLGSTMVGCTMNGQAAHPASVSQGKAEKMAAFAARRATKAMARHDCAKAVRLAEAAVQAEPRDAGYRMLLGQAYMGAGRFQSAETSFADTLTLDPERDRAALDLALAQVALGKSAAAKSTLADYRDKLPAADYGLAIALAGNADEAVRVLEAATRAPDANAKTRQNLALAYALQGKWNNAKVMAVQDLTPDAADARLAEWAKYARPGGASDQVTALLGVRRAADSGQPAQLALAAPAKTVETAMVEPTPAPVVGPAPVVDPAPPPMAPPPMAPPEAPVFETAAVATPAPTRPVAPLIKAEPAPARLAVRTAMTAPVAARALHPVAGGKFVVQLGAFNTVAVGEHAWNRVSAKVDLAGFDAVNGAAKLHNASLVRVAVAGFGTRADANAMCANIRRTGNVCFVRLAQGDAPARWVQKRSAVKVAAR